MAFIGPGSEWFWTAFSGSSSRSRSSSSDRQFRLQSDAAATEQVNDFLSEWSSERMARAKLTVLLALEAGTDPLDLPDRALSHVGFFGNGWGPGQRGHMDRRIVYEHLGSQIQDWWTWLSPRVLAEREAATIPGCGRASSGGRGRGREGTPMAACGDRMVSNWRRDSAGFVEYFRQAIELEEALRSVQVRLTGTPIPAAIIGRNMRLLIPPMRGHAAGGG